MKTSLVMATYNGLKYIEAQLDSIRNQSQRLDEVIIGDDGSQDGTPEFIESYIKTHGLKNWRLERNSENLGWRKNFIELLKKSTGDVIFLSDQDDVWELEKVKLMSEKMKENSNVWLLACTFEEFVESGGRKEKKHKIDFTEEKGLKKVSMSLKNLRQLGPGNCDAVRRELIPFALDFFELNPEAPHDVCLEWTAKAMGRHYILPMPLVHFRKYEASSFRKEIAISPFEGTVKIHKEYIKLYEILLKVIAKHENLVPQYQETQSLIEQKQEQYSDIVSFLTDKSYLAPFKVFKESGLLKTLNLIRLKALK